MRRGSPRNRAFRVALVISGILHLSTVSVFSIMIWFPRHDPKYFSVEIVRQESAPGAAAAPTHGGALRVRSAEELFAGDDVGSSGDRIAENAMADAWAGLPPIELPRIEFGEFERLRTREESLKIRSQFTELFDMRPKDSWELFSAELRGLGQRLRSGLMGREAPAPAPRPVRVSTPAPGFGIYVQWMGSPYDRQLLFSPPVQALWDVDAVEVAGPIALAFTVNPQGKVIEIQIPVEDEKGLASAIGTALLNYRFAPLSEGDRDQRGTLLVAPESAPDAAGTGLGLLGTGFR
ncbi:MAG TPA: hypothetical protein VMZ06_01555 [Candidatus Bathyarchaeia archaeon]|nr:hypothetical protein [Candidatus Bathyarchaeia archaeon]